LEHRAWEHKNHVVEGFTSKYKLDRLVYYEQFSDPVSAITREKKSSPGGARRRMSWCGS
jgi:putative endonuclease